MTQKALVLGIFYGQFYFLIAGMTGIAKILFATMSVDYFYARKEQKFVQAQKKTPQSFDYGVYMVARGGIEPPTQGFSILCSTD